MLSYNLKDVYTRIAPASKKQINDKIKELTAQIQNTAKDVNTKISLFEQLLNESDYKNNDIKLTLTGLKNSIEKLQKEHLECIQNLDMQIVKNYQNLEKQLNTNFEKLNAELKGTTLSLTSDLRKSRSEITKELKTFINQELQRRDNWAIRAAEVKRLANNRPIWVIKCPAPDDNSKIKWGDYSFAMTLKQELQRNGIYVLVDTSEDWGCESGADVVLVLRGLFSYHPDRRNNKCLYIMWNISHPDMVTDEEYQLYDVICVGSYHYANKLKERITIPVIPLLQCTDTEIFYPPAISPNSFERKYIFIGNSKRAGRSSVIWAIEDHLPLKIWGSGWNTILKDHLDLIEAPYIENSKIPELYRTSKVALNDHWDDMRKNNFVNNRIFDVLACGLPVISDTCPELKELFPDAVLHYETKEEFDDCIRKVEQDYDAIRLKVREQWPLIQKEYSFKTRAKQLLEMAEQYHV